MKPRIFIFILALLSFIPESYAIDAPFDRLQGKAWALVLTGPDIDPLYVEQLAMLQPEAETIKQREMVVIHFHGRTLKAYPEMSVTNFELPSLNGSKHGKSSHDKIKGMESQLQTDDDVFSVVLVGKDGLVLYKWLEPVWPAAIYDMMDHPVPMGTAAPTPAVKTKP